ncbi:aspartate kinase [Solibacillus sp. FSL W7-1472]|uniref:Aspartokinase n=2 Tax=Solibacillus TaxID=648800 RepID=F2F543_SOLSS|nr:MULTISPECIES: aspartate kinase [Solibacillus]AMO85092.1 aspartate kinase [Solibacillus silvestris]EKB43699.1 Aspartokinase I/homoserine dehydrogenase I [Solibacillus isronensis B3W22]OBW55943.1 aspartate kinase [Solibacillus silvestris]BAK17008.1 aspartokinase [Solibacillus silvestris StLB046]
MIVCKFGGTSVASAEQIKKVASIVKSNPERKIVAVSAPGKRSSDDIKVTDLLIDLANTVINKGDVEAKIKAVVNRYRNIAEDLGLDNTISDIIEQDIRGRVTENWSDKDLFLDNMKASGEDNNAKLIACYFNAIGMPAKYISPKDKLILNDFPERTYALPEAYENLSVLKNTEEIIIFPGFFGYTKSGVLRTFDRGGSDITGSILASAVGAELYENFTDVDCVFAANPKVVNDPVDIKEITYREMRELSYAGFSVFHDEALMPVYKQGIPVNIKNTNNPSASGTLILPTRPATNRPVTGISADSGFSILYVSKYLMNREVGFGRKLLQIIEEENISYEHTPSGLDDISVIMRSSQLSPEIEARIVKRVKEELCADDVQFSHNFSMIVIVGEGMRHNTGLAARAATAISATGANIEMINQGSSEVSLVFGVRSEYEDQILKGLYEEFFATITSF